MSQVSQNVCELLPSRPCELYGPRAIPANSRTLLKQYLLDPVLPVLTLLSMSALTVVMLMVIVTTVADMDVQLPGSYANVDPMSGWTDVSARRPYQDQGAYAEMAMSADPFEDRDSRPLPPDADSF